MNQFKQYKEKIMIAKCKIYLVENFQKIEDIRIVRQSLKSPAEQMKLQML